MGKLTNGKAAGKDEITGEMIKGGSDRVVNWIWRLCNTASESGVLPETGYRLCLFHCARLKEKGQNVVIIDLLVC